MSSSKLFVSQQNVFSGISKSFEKASFVVLGVPFDVTSTFRTGARFGPTAIRQASLNIETYSFRSSVDVENLKLHDLGDLHVSTDAEKTLNMLDSVVEDIVEKGKIPVIIGGEHTITLGAFRALRRKFSGTAIASFDAHMDLRNEYLGTKLSHTTFMRRLAESFGGANVVEIGTRAVCREELDYAKKAGIEFFTTRQIKREGSQRILNKLKEKLSHVKSFYLSVDLDVLDPAYVPAVQNPEGDGLDMSLFLDILTGICDDRVIGFDVLEVAPLYDQGISALQAAKVIFEMLCCIAKAKKYV